MASTGINFNELTPSAGDVRELSALVMKDVLSPERIGAILNVFNGVYNGDKIGIIGEYGLLGKESQGCNPEYANNSLDTSEKTWDLPRWEIAEKLCYADLENTLVKYYLNAGTDVSDLTSNEYLRDIIMPRLELGITKMFFRIAFFGDKAAKTVSDGGVIKDGVDTDYFTLTDGIWKQIFGIVSADAARRVTIAANSEATKADQINNFVASAVDTMNDLINGAPARLRGANDQVILISQSFADAFETGLLTAYPGSDLHWKDLFDGIREGRYRGIKVRVMPIFDEIIQNYEGTATAYNLPHRAIYTTERNLALGVKAENEMQELSVVHDDVTRFMHLYATDRMGALVVDDGLIQVAY